MRIINLIENTSGSNTACLTEHGLSFYIETEKHKVLLDTGASKAFAENAKLLGVDLAKVDLAVLSHGHYDHAGGLLTFAEINGHAPIYMRKEATGNFYHGERYIGIDPEILNLDQVCLVDGDICLGTDDLRLFGNVTGRKLWPQGNLELKDDFSHEQYLVIRENGKAVLFSGCAHNGIVNILEHYKELFGEEPDAVFSGFHMRKKDGYQDEDLEMIKATALELKRWKTMFYTGHCTGELPFEIMKEIMGDQLVYVHSGDSVCM